MREGSEVERGQSLPDRELPLQQLAVARQQMRRQLHRRGAADETAGELCEKNIWAALLGSFRQWLRLGAFRVVQKCPRGTVDRFFCEQQANSRTSPSSPGSPDLRSPLEHPESLPDQPLTAQRAWSMTCLNGRFHSQITSESGTCHL